MPEKEDQLFGTASAQARIWQHQHPSDPSLCRSSHGVHGAKFLVARTGPLNGHGIGSLIHILASNLGLAMSLGRILVLDPGDGNVFATDRPSTGFCGNTTSFECFLMPLSSCSMADALAHNPSKLDWHTPSRAEDPTLAEERTLQTIGENFKHVPPQLQDLANCSAVPPEKHWYWWRAQATAYLVRLNPKAQAEVRRRIGMYMPAFIPPGTISTHVRHGDKGIEMRLLAAEDFLAAAELTAARLPLLLGRQVFVSTEDPEVLAAAAAWTRHNDWSVYATSNQRANVAIYDLVERFGGVNEMLNSLMNLELALRCDAWVCTLGSNWCSLIDELRSTTARKAHQPYVDIGFRCFQGCEDG